MTIKLIDQVSHDRLIDLQEKYPNLTLQNVGYEYIDKSKLTPEELAAIQEIEALLKDHILGFSSFSNFRKNREGQLQIRFQYNYEADKKVPSISFIGVGYLLIEELLIGFL